MGNQVDDPYIPSLVLKQERKNMDARNDELNNLQNRVDAILMTPMKQPPAQATIALATERAAAPPSQKFSPFDPAQMQRVTKLSGQFMALANSKEGVAGLSAVLNEVEKVAAIENPDLVRYALMLFITHYPRGSQLKIRPLERRAPQIVLASRQQAAPLRTAAALTEIPSEASLNWFREDPKANEHHEHWHLVYPFSGIPDPKNPDSVQTRDRQGELFLYMHEQMIARYNAERLAAGLDTVKPFPSIDDYSEQVPDGYNPDPHLEEQPSGGQIVPFSSRPSGKQFMDLGQPSQPNFLSVANLKQWGDNLLQAAQSGSFQDGTQVNANLLGATVEASIDSVDSNTYGNHHNYGHVFLANANDPQDFPQDVPGVMNTPITAIRDPIFFRWHKHIDDISFQWQETQSPNDFSDAPSVLIRDGFNAVIGAQQSPGIILCFKDKNLSSVADDSDASWQAFGEANFGGANWDKDFSSGDTTTSELQTAMRQRQITIPFPEGDSQAETIQYLYPREFFYFLRVENQLAQAKDVTVRIFLAPTGSYAGITEVAEDRRMWIEMDKFRCTLQPSRQVIFRRAEVSSVIRKPAVKTFDTTDADEDVGDVSCDCGWPYNLLLPRGTRNGMKFRLMVMITDWEKDLVPDETTCGSMSYCGAKDKYPDSRDMGYPFDRPFPANRSIMQIIATQNNMAALDITIKWVDSVPG